MDLIKELNDEQRAVVENGDGACLVLAGAGSGKTRTITYRVAELLEKGVQPNEILLVTFTNKAAAAMQQRLGQITNTLKPLPWSGTFHHIGYRLLRMHAPLIGYRNNFTVLDSDDSESIIKLCVKEHRPESGVKFPSASVIHNLISFSRNSEQPLSQVVEDRALVWIKFTEEIGAIARLYETKKREANALDFDDLLVKTKELLQSDSVRGKYASQFKYVLVDEYQDTNVVQAEIIRLLASVHKNILVVGDDAQSIYSFRAATIQNILNFEKIFPGAKVFKLQTNYRSTGAILALANNSIANNVNQYKKELRTVKGEAVKPLLQPQMDQQSEGQWIAEKILKELQAGKEPSEIAVLFRAASHSQALEVELVARGIDYDYRGGVRFFERAHIKDILCYLRILANFADTAAWLRVLLHEEGIGPVAADKLIAAVKGVTNVDEIAPLGQAILGNKAYAGWQNFVRIFDSMLQAPTKSPSSYIQSLLASPYKEYLESEYIDSKDRLDDIAQLARFAERHDDLDTFLAESTLQESFRAIEGDTEQEAKIVNQNSKIILSTIHQAKGLEWDTVFIINLARGAFPGERAMREENGIEEERRLFYVAVTRAREHLYLTYPMAGGAFGDFLSGPSMFIEEVHPDLLDDRSLLSTPTTILNDSRAGVSYVPEDEPFVSPPKIRPGSFLRDIEDL